MPRDLFAEAGINPNLPEQRAPRDLFAEAGIIPQETEQSKSQANPSMLDRIADNPIVNAINSIGAGANIAERKLGAGVVNLASRLLGKGAVMDAPKRLEAPYPLLADVAEIGTDLAMPLPGVNKASALAKGSGMLAKALAGLGDSALTGAGYGALYGASDKDKSLVRSGLEGAGAGALLSAILKGGAGGINAITKLGKRSPEEMSTISQRIGDVPLNISEVADSDALRKLSSIVDSIPFSGGRASKQRQVANIEDEATKFIDRLRGNADKGASEEALLNDLRDNRNFHKKISKDNYSAISKLAESEAMSPDSFGQMTRGIKIMPNKLSSAINNVKNKYTNIDMPDLPIIKDLINGKIGQYSYKESNGYQSSLRKAVNSAIVQGDNQKAAAYGQLREALLNDMQTHLAKSSMPELAEQFQSARRYHAENVAPYEKSENASVYKSIIGNKQPESIAKELVKPENTKIVEHMSQEQRDLLAYNLLKKRLDTDAAGEDVISPAYLVNDINSIPKRYRDLLFGDKKQELSKLESLTKLTKDLRNSPSKSQTGRSLKENIQDTAKIGGAYGLAKLGWVPAVSTLGASSALANALRRYMESPKARQDFINQQIISPKKADTTTNALLRAYLANRNTGEKN